MLSKMQALKVYLVQSYILIIRLKSATTIVYWDYQHIFSNEFLLIVALSDVYATTLNPTLSRSLIET